jgi:hypothetical protein
MQPHDAALSIRHFFEKKIEISAQFFRKKEVR